ncbi:MAG: hypothetical protein QOF20_1427 [Acidimicrobiaceae bacterium]|nr:hypothetical protein [Acidimicrobiaceae bacterium]
MKRGRHASTTRRAALVAGGFFLAGIVGIAVLQTATGDLWHAGVHKVVQHATPPPLDVQNYPSQLIVHASSADAPVFVVPQTPAELRTKGGPSGGGDDAFDSWVASLGGAPADAKTIGIQLGSNVSEALPIAGVRVRVLDRSAPLSGTRVINGAGYLGIRVLDVDLDMAVPEGVPQAGRDGPWHFPLQVGHGTDTEVIGVHVHTNAYLVHYVIDIDYVYKGTVRTFEVMDHGHPFSVTSSARAVSSD